MEKSRAARKVRRGKSYRMDPHPEQLAGDSDLGGCDPGPGGSGQDGPVLLRGDDRRWKKHADIIMSNLGQNLAHGAR